MRTVLFVLCTLAVAFGNLYSQGWDVPTSRPNTRHAYDMYTIPRPALSLRGFDNQNLGAFTNTFSPKVFNQPITNKEVVIPVFWKFRKESRQLCD